jgi:hypothetical protein
MMRQPARSAFCTTGRQPRGFASLITLAALLTSGPFGLADDAADRAELEHFEKRIRPVLVRYCYECHSGVPKEPKGGLRLDSREATRRGGDSGAAVVPGKAAHSLLMQALRFEGLEMPPKKRLPDSVIADFERWIDKGAVDPRDNPPAANDVAGLVWEAQFAERRYWWSLQPVARPVAPTINNAVWAETDIDRFILAALEEKQLHPAPRADRTTLARRLSQILLGLPPNPDDVDRFVKDDSPEAWPRLVDRTLASPHFGERFARHWMDAVRYSDTYGYEWDIPAKGAWRYRDYLIKAFNDDIAYDQLVREQIAGDLLEHPRIDPVEQINLSLIGPMFYQLGEKRHGDSSEFDGIHQEMIDNKVDAFSKAFQGTTVACARCHDHKLDAVAQKEYYALAGTFMSSRWVSRTLDVPARDAALRDEMKQIKRRLRSQLALVWRRQLDELSADTLMTLWKAKTKPPEQKGNEKDGNAAATPKPAPIPVEDPLSVWSNLMAGLDAKKSPKEAWEQAIATIRDEQQRRVAQNVANVELVADFTKSVPAGWSVDGVGLRERTPTGDPLVALNGDTALTLISAGGLVTNSLSPRMNGAVRTPYNTALPAGMLHFEISGGEFAARRTVYDNAFLTEKQEYLNTRLPVWKAVDPVQAMPNRNIYVEFATKTSNPNFPPRVGLGGACSEEQVAQPQSWFAISRVMRQKGQLGPALDLGWFAVLMEESKGVESIDAATAAYRGWFDSALTRWADKDVENLDDVRLLNWLIDAGLFHNRLDDRMSPEVKTLVNEYRALEARLAEPQTVNGMADIDPGLDYRLNIRGEYDQFGPPAPRGYLEALNAPKDGFQVRNSGRRELAEIIASPQNPLTARVYVNRVWQWLFGQGIVRTPDDFGHLGDAPSHPALLDHLARRFMDEGWSTKRLVREILLSATWQQSGETTEAARTADPDNRLLLHFKLQRLDAESLRDSILAVSGRLSQQLYGPAINPNRPKEDPQKRLFSGPVDGDGRRSLYVKMTIMEVPKFLAAFNQPDPKIPTGRRDVTNTAAQSLALLNDPFVTGQAEHWATSLMKTNDSTPADRIERMFRKAFGRAASPAELARWSESLKTFAADRSIPEGAQMQSVPLWKDMAHALLNLKETIYVR